MYNILLNACFNLKKKWKYFICWIRSLVDYGSNVCNLYRGVIAFFYRRFLYSPNVKEKPERVFHTYIHTDVLCVVCCVIVFFSLYQHWKGRKCPVDFGRLFDGFKRNLLDTKCHTKRNSFSIAYDWLQCDCWSVVTVWSVCFYSNFGSVYLQPFTQGKIIQNPTKIQQKSNIMQLCKFMLSSSITNYWQLSAIVENITENTLQI